MKYQIKAEYRTGDSFHSEDTSTVLPHEWESLDNAKAALQRIREHWLWYEYANASRWRIGSKPEEPEWHKGQPYDFTLILKLDNGNDVKMSAPWCGYFESLHGASIILPEDEEMSFTV